MLFRGINVVSVAVPDLDIARAFYRDTLEFGEPIYDFPDAGWIEFATGGAGNLSLTTQEPDTAGGSATTVVLNVDDCVATIDRLRSRGVRCDDPMVFPGFVTWASFYDPFGNRLQCCSPAPAPA
jgi:predicted enzyme related to lactoylglutathione lyase